jgi:hypothetical protein
MKKHNVIKVITIIVVMLCASTVTAEDTALKGTVYLYAPQAENPIPVSGYEVKLYNVKQQKSLNPSITDAYGRYAFFGIPRGKYVLSITKAGPYWRQRVWRQEVTAPGTPDPIVLPQAASIVPHASYLEVKGQKDTYDFSLWLDAPPEQKARIKKVVYLFNHPTFETKEFVSRNKADGFKVGYKGWGCLTNVTIKVKGRDTRSQISFNMCEALKDF